MNATPRSADDDLALLIADDCDTLLRTVRFSQMMASASGLLGERDATPEEVARGWPAIVEDFSNRMQRLIEMMDDEGDDDGAAASNPES